MKNYRYIGLPIAKPYQAIAVIFSLIFLAIASLIANVKVEMLLFFSLIALLINGYWFLFANVKFNSKEFIVEKFLWRKSINANDFVAVKRVWISCYKITFVNASYYFFMGVNSLFKNDEEVNGSLKSKLV